MAEGAGVGRLGGLDEVVDEDFEDMGEWLLIGMVGGLSLIHI